MKKIVSYFPSLLFFLNLIPFHKIFSFSFWRLGAFLLPLWGLGGFLFAQPRHLDTKQANAICFVENKGQWNNVVQYRAEIPSGFFWLTKDGFHYTIYNKNQMQVPHGIAGITNDMLKNLPEKIDAHHISVEFLKYNKNTTLKAQKIRNTTFNYFFGNDKTKWGKGAKSYDQIHYENVYNGIDALVFTQENSLKYEFHVKSFAKTNQIKMKYKGAEKLYLENGNLIIKTPLGEIKEQKPYSYQVINGKKIEVLTEFYLQGDEVSFRFPKNYDTNHELIIDPVLIFSTYSGSFADNWGSTATFDEDGNLYAGGIIFSDNTTGFPVTQGSFQVTRQGLVDIGILKFNPQGTSLIYCTYLGGNNSEFPHSLVVNSNKELIVFGTTGSNNFPTTQGAVGTAFRGGTNSNINGITYSNGIDMFVTRFNMAGSQLIGSTYFGGSANDGVNDTSPTSINNVGDQFRGEVITDAQNNIYIASTTKSNNLILQNAFQSSISGTQDGIIIKFNSNLTQMLWGSYFGGSGFDAIYGIKLNSLGDVYVCGVTLSPNLRANVPVSAPAPYQNTNLGSDEGFLAKISNAGALQQVTYIGTSLANQIFFVDFDPQDNPHVLGLTNGTYPVSSSVFSNPNSGQFIQKFNPDLTTSLFSTTIGTGKNSPDIAPTAFMVNNCSNIYIAGWGSPLSPGLATTGLPITPDAVKSVTDGGDFYFMILQKDALSLLYGTFFGASTTGDHVDGGTCRFEKSGIIYHSACASCGGQSNTFPTTSGSVSTTNNSPNCNNAAFKFDIGSLIVDFNIFDAGTNVIVQQACQFPFPSVIRYQGIGATTFLWKVDGVTVSNTNVFNFQFPNAGNYVVTLTAGNPVACLPSITVTKIFKVSMVSIDQNTNITACKGVPVQLTSNITSSNPFTYSWTPTTGLDNPTIANPTATPTQTTTYTLTATDNNGCVRTKTAKVTIIPPLTNDFDIFNGANIPAGEFCLPAFVRLKYDTTGLGLQVSSWTWDVQNVGIFTNQAQVNLTINQVGSYTITLTVNRIGQCPETLTKTKTIIVKSLGLQVSPTQTICIGGNTQLNATSTFANVQYSWSPVLGLSNPNIPNPIANPTRTTSYLITISDNTGCQSEANVLVEVEPDIKGDFEWEYISDCGKPTAIQLKPSFQGGNQFLWTISDGTTYNTEIPNAHIFKNAGIYTITALVKNGACQKTFQKTIEVENNALAPPNVITPNNDGKNETFVIPDRQNYKLEIYTRIGTSVFKSDNYQNDWGQDALVGVYYYLLTSPKGVKCKGWIEVMK